MSNKTKCTCNELPEHFPTKCRACEREKSWNSDVLGMQNEEINRLTNELDAVKQELSELKLRHIEVVFERDSRETLLQSKEVQLKVAIEGLTKEAKYNCSCGGDEPDGSSPMCYPHQTLFKLKESQDNCCDNESRSIEGGCTNCGDPCL